VISDYVTMEAKTGSAARGTPRVAASVLLLGLLLLSIGAGLWAGAGQSQAAVSSTLYAGFDADGFIHLSFTDGTMIGTPNPPGTVVTAGTYSIVVNNNGVDLGDVHYFQLTGPGVNLSVGTNLYDTTTWTATFQPSSTYVYSDTQNPTTIREVFGTPGSGAGTGTTTPATVTTTPGSPAPGKSPTKPTSNNPLGTAIVPFRGNLAGAVSPKGALTLTVKGKKVTTLVTGRYKIVVADDSRKSGFNIQEIRKGATAVTSTGFVGKHAVTLDLKPGQWFFYPSFLGKKTYFIVVAS
jgi:hypothetical protein